MAKQNKAQQKQVTEEETKGVEEVKQPKEKKQKQ